MLLSNIIFYDFFAIFDLLLTTYYYLHLYKLYFLLCDAYA